MNAVVRAQLAFQMLTLLQQGKSEGFVSCDWPKFSPGTLGAMIPVSLDTWMSLK